MTGIVEIYNQALTSCGAENLVSLPTDVSREAEICNLWFDTIRDQVLRAAFWPSTKKSYRLPLIAERDTTVNWTAAAPDPGWRFIYGVPSDMLAPRFISDYSRFELTVSSTNTSAIVTDTEAAILTYTFRQTNPNMWDISLRMAIINALAAVITMPLTGKLQRAKWNAEQANNAIIAARVDAANTNENQVETLPDWITARGYGGVIPSYRYVYPYGPLVAISSVPSVS